MTAAVRPIHCWPCSLPAFLLFLLVVSLIPDTERVNIQDRFVPSFRNYTYICTCKRSAMNLLDGPVTARASRHRSSLLSAPCNQLILGGSNVKSIFSNISVRYLGILLRFWRRFLRWDLSSLSLKLEASKRNRSFGVGDQKERVSWLQYHTFISALAPIRPEPSSLAGLRQWGNPIDDSQMATVNIWR
ncbi:uncharacterized protein EV420DRAFT_1484997 [Desarmillaria tabescens]|uniref:Uncharacterized protein n=1 Tax=Armillaria tabescens TaxID=1929756 RepID=A0AA39JL58_ARMTA|nr:uncharacterized protein EV420DRAFT_1484997 [Desarmillaria tabescens]KAK0443349.1 hypothetical protein EV420DRAFT_1484997 [Desarmillaria tabescens]